MVPAMVLAAIDAPCESGATNMLDRPRVIEIARAFGAEEAADWIEAHRSQFAKGIFQGFVAESGADTAE